MSFHYYLKKCGRQELGSIGTDGKPQRGRYLMTSMNPDILNFFPPLSQTQLNDFVPVACVPLYLPEKPKVYCNFVYHNDKFHNSTAANPRNEHRLYLSMDLEGGFYRIKKDDYVVFRKKDAEDVNSELFLDLVTPVQLKYYKLCEKIMSQSKYSGGYAIYDGILPDFETKIPIQESSEIKVDKKIIDSIEKNEKNQLKKNVASLFNQVMFRDFLLVGYEGLCAITRVVIRHESLMNIEAAHIRPQAHKGNFLPNNGLMLSRDLHWAFDKGFFTLSDELEIIVHPDSHSTYLDQFAGKKIFIPSDPFFRPCIDNIRWHRLNLYGQFKNIRGDNQ